MPIPSASYHGEARHKPDWFVIKLSSDRVRGESVVRVSRPIPAEAIADIDAEPEIVASNFVFKVRLQTPVT